jgi:hypothetical protein
MPVYDRTQAGKFPSVARGFADVHPRSPAPQYLASALKLRQELWEVSMAHNEQEQKRPQGGGPQGHPSNQGPSKAAGSNREGTDEGRGGNKTTQGQGSDTGNKGKN